MEVWDFTPPTEEEEDDESKRVASDGLQDMEMEMVDVPVQTDVKDTMIEAYGTSAEDSEDMTD